MSPQQHWSGSQRHLRNPRHQTETELVRLASEEASQSPASPWPQCCRNPGLANIVDNVSVSVHTMWIKPHCVRLVHTQSVNQIDATQQKLEQQTYVELQASHTHICVRRVNSHQQCICQSANSCQQCLCQPVNNRQRCMRQPANSHQQCSWRPANNCQQCMCQAVNICQWCMCKKMKAAIIHARNSLRK